MARARRSRRKPDFDAQYEAWTRHTVMEQTADYVRRGRAYRDVPAEELLTGWSGSFKVMAALPQHPVVRALNADLEAELGLRGIPLPMERVAAASRELADKAMALYEAASPEAQRSIGEAFLRELRAVSAGGARGH